MSLVAGFKQGRQAWAKAGFRLGAKGSTAWRWAGRGRKEKDLMVGQISFYVFCCCVVRMDGFVQNRINEFVQRQFVSLSKAIHSVLHKLLHKYYVVFKAIREQEKAKFLHSANLEL